MYIICESLGCGRYDPASAKPHEATMISIPLDTMFLAEKLEAMEALWVDLSRTPGDVPIPKWHRDVLKSRQESPATWLDWEQVKASLREMAKHEAREKTLDVQKCTKN